jgi:hypothetical protein
MGSGLSAGALVWSISIAYCWNNSSHKSITHSQGGLISQEEEHKNMHTKNFLSLDAAHQCLHFHLSTTNKYLLQGLNKHH